MFQWNKKLFFVFICLSLKFCSSFLKPNIYLLDTKFEQIQADSFFIVELSQNHVQLFTNKNIENYEEEFKKLSPHINPNLYSIYALKTGNLSLAEKTWFEMLKDFDFISFLNLLRTFYILEDFEGMQNLFQTFYLRKDFSFQKTEPILEILISQNRFQELLFCLDYLSHNVNLNLAERIKIGNYYLTYSELEKAKREFEKVLEVYSYQKEALGGMFKIYFYESKYESSEMFFKTYSKFYKLNEELLLLGAELYYKLSRYKEGLELLKQIQNPKEKEKYFSLKKALQYSYAYKLNPSSQEEVEIFQRILLGE